MDIKRQPLLEAIPATFVEIGYTGHLLSAGETAASGFKFEVAPKRRPGKRLVIGSLDGKEVFRDQIDTDEAKHRKRCCEQVLKKIPAVGRCRFA